MLIRLLMMMQMVIIFMGLLKGYLKLQKKKWKN